MTLSSAQHRALQDLAQKGAGKIVPWTNIADAQALTELGLARRSRSGWEITDDGAQFLQGRDEQPRASAVVYAFHESRPA
jgi:hypothetical protein